MATEKVPKDPTTSKSRNDLEILSLNFLRSQNISQIPDDDHIPKLHPCKLCSKAMFGFQFEALTILRCGHLLHRLCVETHIIRGETKFPSCPICKADIEILREELILASGECDVLPRSYDKGLASQQSNVTIDDDDGGLEIMRSMGLIEEDESPGKTKQVNVEDRGTSPIATISVTTQEQATSPIANIPVTAHEQATSPISNEKGNLVQVNSTDQSDTNDTIILDQSTGEGKDTTDSQTRTSRQVSPKVIREQDKLQELLRELYTPTKGESTETNDDEETEDSISHSLARLYQKAMKAGLRATKANQEEISCWYHYAKGCEDRVKEIMENDRRLNGQQAMSRVYDEVKNHLPDTTLVNLRKKTQKARVIYKLFVEIGVGKIKRLVQTPFQGWVIIKLKVL